MSLINEALKKAQKQRTGESPSLSAVPTLGGERPDQIARRGKSSGIGELLLPVSLGVAGVGLLVAGAFFLLNRQGGETAAPQPVTVATTPPAAAVQPAPAAVPSVPAPVVAAPLPQPEPPAPAVSTFTVPNVTASAPAPAVAEPAGATVAASAPAPAVAAPAAPAFTLPVAPVVATPPPRPAAPAAKLEPRAINYIEALRVAGIRVSATDPKDSKVLMSDRVYRLGQLVEAEMGLRLVGITATSLTFEDDRGNRYTREFN